MHRTKHIFPRNFSFLFSSSFPFFIRTIAATSNTSINTNKPIKNHQNNIIVGAFSIIHTSQVYNPNKYRFVKFKSALYLKNNGIIYHFRNHTMPLLLFSSIHQTKHIPVYDNIIYRVRLVQL